MQSYIIYLISLLSPHLSPIKCQLFWHLVNIISNNLDRALERIFKSCTLFSPKFNGIQSYPLLFKECRIKKNFHLEHVNTFDTFTEVSQTNKRSYRIIRLFLGKKVYHRQGNNGIDAKKQVDTDISDKGHSCFMEEPSQ